MNEDLKKTAPQAGFVAVGIMLIVIGLNSSRLLIVAGVVFLIAAIIQQRKSRSLGDAPKE